MQRYRTTNWREYNAALKARGSLLVWLDRDMTWVAPTTGKRGRSPTFTDAAIQFCLTVKALFGLPLRQTSGMVEVRIQPIFDGEAGSAGRTHFHTAR